MQEGKKRTKASDFMACFRILHTAFPSDRKLDRDHS